MLKKERLNGIIKSLGLVFGDIGTSPIYTLTVIFLLTLTYKPMLWVFFHLLSGHLL